MPGLPPPPTLPVCLLVEPHCIDVTAAAVGRPVMEPRPLDPPQAVWTSSILDLLAVRGHEARLVCRAEVRPLPPQAYRCTAFMGPTSQKTKALDNLFHGRRRRRFPRGWQSLGTSEQEAAAAPPLGITRRHFITLSSGKNSTVPSQKDDLLQ